MATKHRIFVKLPSGVQPQPIGQGLTSNVVTSVDCDSVQLHDTMRKLEQQYPNHRFTCKPLDTFAV